MNPEELRRFMDVGEVDRFECPHCQVVFFRHFSIEQLGEFDIAPFPNCKKPIDFYELDELNDDFYYLAPVLFCECGSAMELPYSPLPRTDKDGKVLLQGEDPPTLPPEGWSAIFGCRACGRISTYAANVAEMSPVLKLTVGQHQSGKGVYYARFPCGDRRCSTLASVYVDIRVGNASEVLESLRSGLYDGQILECGHSMKTVPAKFYTIEPVLKRMW
jgi:hypothetical protein